MGFGMTREENFDIIILMKTQRIIGDVGREKQEANDLLLPSRGAKKGRIPFLILLILILGIGFFVWQKQNNEEIIAANIEEPEDIVVKLPIEEGSTFGVLMNTASISPATTTAIFNAAENVYDLSKIRISRTIDLVFDKQTDEFKQLIYQIDTEEELFVTKQQGTSTSTSTSPVWIAERIPIPYEIKIKTAEGTITSSMYETALEQGIDERAIIDLANVFQWSVDFALDVRVGDTFKFIYEERYRDGKYIMPGQILAGKYVNDGTPYHAFYFSETEKNTGYFDPDGNSVQKIFLKAPVAYKYISSGFTYGKRYVQAFNVSTGHRAIDYAAPYGTPVRSVGDGRVTYAGWNGSYGNFVTVQHNGTYSTNYAHMSSVAVRSGTRVTQGQTIGYVGSTGFSTGPHLHYEMVKYGAKVNPLREVLPPGEAIKDENKPRFFEEIKPYQEQLN